ncbi:hypothetical protein [Thermus sp.]|uniref:hypothetical protein n=1 Tax=Thermus sp. TaxID=275 RepID=UPI00307E6012
MKAKERGSKGLLQDKALDLEDQGVRINPPGASLGAVVGVAATPKAIPPPKPAGKPLGKAPVAGVK